MTSDRIFLIGASGHAKVVLDAARRQGVEVVALFDDNPALAGTIVMDCQVIGGRNELLAWCTRHGVSKGIVAIGNNGLRGDIARWVEGQGLGLATVVHPAAVLGAGVRLGPGSVLMAGTVVNADARLGANVIVNTGATVDHDCVIGDNVHIAPGCHLCGHVRVGAGTLLGAGSTVIPGVAIGAGVVVGAGSTVIVDVADDAKVAGSPCRELK